MKVKFIEMSQKEYDNNLQAFGGEYTTEYFGEGYGIEDFYSDNANVVLEEMGNGFYTFTTDDGETRYVYVEECKDESNRIVMVDNVELTPDNYEKLIGYGTRLERAVDNACDAFYDGTTEEERRQGIITEYGCHEILIREVEE